MKNKTDKMKDLQKVRRRKLVIQKKTSTFDEWENETMSWVDWRTVWAERNELFGQEYYAAKSLGEEKTIKWTVKYVAFLEEINTTDYRIIYSNKDIYDIKDTDQLQDDGMWFVIKAEKSGELDG